MDRCEKESKFALPPLELLEPIGHTPADGEAELSTRTRSLVDKLVSLNQEENPNPKYGMTEDSLYNDAVRIVVSGARISVSILQRRLRIGYGRAAKLVDTMHRNGVFGSGDGSKPRGPS